MPATTVIICAWCRKRLTERVPLPDEQVSYGICEACAARGRAEMEADRPPNPSVDSADSGNRRR